MALSSSLVSLGTIVGIYALLALGLNVKFGYTGLLDIGHVAFYLVGAYVTALLVLPPAETQQFATYVLGLNWPWLPAIAVGVVAAAVTGLLVALPAIRLREDYLAIVVLGVSVILQRVVQSEGWLANGPGSLRGFSLPFRTAFPLPGETLVSAVLFGAVVFVLWSVATYLLARLVVRPAGTVPPDRTEVDGGVGTGRLRRGLVDGALAVSTLGVGYWAARRATRRSEQPDARYVLLAGLIAGVVAGGAAYVGGGMADAVALVFLGLMSVFTWLFGGVTVARRYRDLSLGDFAIALGLAVAFVVAFVPLVVTSGSGQPGTLGLAATIGLLVVFLYATYYFGVNWDRLGTGAGFVRIVGVGAIWLFCLRYFVMANVTPWMTGGLDAVLDNTYQNLLWLLKFNAAGPVFDYARFLLVLTVASVAIGYYVMETTVGSPFGRVLKAVREDEDVAEALGKNTFAFKVQSMMLGSALAGFAGGLTVLYFKSLVHTMFAPRVTFIAFLMVIIGGAANNRGVVLGAVIYWAFQKGTADIAGFFPPAARASVQALRLATIGALLIIILYYRPEGIWGERASTDVAEE